MSLGARLVQGGALSAGGMLASMLGGLVTWKLLSTAPGLDPAALGAYAVFIIAGDIGLVALSFGVRTALPKLVGEAPAEARAAQVAGLLGTQLLLSVGAGLVLLPFFWVAGRLSGGGLAAVLWAVPLYMAGASLREFMLAAHAGLNSYRRRAAALLAFALAQAGFVYVLVWQPAAGLAWAAAAVLLAHAAGALVCWALLPAGRVPRLDVPGYRAAARFALPLWGNNFFNLLYQRVDTLLVYSLLGAATAGLYEVGAKKMPAYATGLLNAGLTPYLPSAAELAARGDGSRAARLLSLAYRAVGVAAYMAAFALAAFSAPLITLLLSAEYIVAPGLVLLVATAGALHLQAGLFGQTLIARGHPEQVARINVSLAVPTLLLAAILLPALGMWGAALAAVAGAAASCAWQMHALARRGLSLPGREGWTQQAALAPCLVGALLAGSAGACAVAGGIFLGSVLGAGVIERAHFAPLRHLLPGYRP